MYCINCGKELRDEDYFCTGCGIKVREVDSSIDKKSSSEEVVKNASITFVGSSEKKQEEVKSNKPTGWILLGLTVLVVLFLILISTGKASDREILNDIPAEYRTIVVDDRSIVLEAVQIDIEKRQTDRDNGEDIIYCNITFENADYEASGDFYLKYQYYDKGGWILEKISRKNSDELQVNPKNGVPYKIIKEYLTYKNIWFSINENVQKASDNYFVSCSINGLAHVTNTQKNLGYEGTVDLICKFSSKYGLNSYVWEISASYNVKPTEKIPSEIASEAAVEKYASSKYISDGYDEEKNIHLYTFAVNEIHENCDISGELVLEYKFLADESVLQPRWDVNEATTSNVSTDWKIVGNWKAEFEDDSQKVVLYIGIDSITGMETISVKRIWLGDCKYTWKYDSWDNPNVVPIEQAYAEPGIMHDGSISFNIRDSYSWRVVIGYDSATMYFPWFEDAPSTDFIKLN